MKMSTVIMKGVFHLKSRNFWHSLFTQKLVMKEEKLEMRLIRYNKMSLILFIFLIIDCARLYILIPLLCYISTEKKK